MILHWGLGLLLLLASFLIFFFALPIAGSIVEEKRGEFKFLQVLLGVLGIALLLLAIFCSLLPSFLGLK